MLYGILAGRQCPSITVSLGGVLEAGWHSETAQFSVYLPW